MPTNNRICILIHYDIYDQIIDCTSILAEYMRADNHTVIISQNIYETPQQVRAYLKTLYDQVQSLQGAILVGKIPIVTFHNEEDQ